MVVILKILAVPALFILPWLLMKLGNREAGLWDTLTGQPLLMLALLLPSVILVAMYIVKLFRGSS